jgi:MoCo/4Fe-4S cofactor protein with predicted Tat translocation signal
MNDKQSGKGSSGKKRVRCTESAAAPVQQGARKAQPYWFQPTSNADGRDAAALECSSYSQTSPKGWWRSLDELQDTDEFCDFVNAEFPSQAPKLLSDVSRRNFLKVMGASMALMTLAGCRWPEEEIVPFAHRPEDTTPGVPKTFASALEIGGVATPVLVKSFDGRPIKVDGNPDHPAGSRGSTAITQASVLGLYDPDRSTRPRKAGKIVPFADFDQFLASHFATQGDGAGLRVLSEAVGSPTLLEMRLRFEGTFGKARWHEYEPFSRDAEIEGLKAATGRPLRAHLDLNRATVIVSLEDDLLGEHPDSVRLTRAFAAHRSASNGEMNRLHVAESTVTVTGGAADHRYVMPSRDVAKLAGELLEQVKSGKATHPIAKDLIENSDGAVVTAGPGQPFRVHHTVFLLNHALGAVGRNVVYTAERERPNHHEDLRALAADMAAGKVETLVILGGNPVFNAPGDVDFAAALTKVKTSIHLGLAVDETGSLATWHAPAAHWLESWSDATAFDGTVTPVQPLIRPLFEGRTPAELIATIIGDGVTKSYDLVRRHWEQVFGEEGFEKSWRQALQDGFFARTAARTVALTVVNDIVAAAGEATGGIEVTIGRDPKIHDGRFANLGWLQELPEPASKLTWDNAALVSVADAAKWNVKTGDHVKVTRGGAAVTIPAFVLPGQAAGSVALHAGNGRPQGGRVAEGSGTNVYPLFAAGGGFTVTKAAGATKLASTMNHHAIDNVGAKEVERRAHDLIRQATLEEYKKDPEFAKHAHGPALVSLFKEHEYEGHRWAMMIDLSSCTGCSACVTACQSENNVPVVGKEEVLIGRDMHWLRVDRYFKGDPEEPEVGHQPIPCMQCENAPCEQVCPVAATVHSDEGLNDMVYNRCIGTRYCSNNCPYKVRRFNWFLNHDGMSDIERMRFNPDVTVRARGVMEKCTYCVQRINAVKIDARNAGREIEDGEVLPACAQSCPAEAIVFGDLSDPESRVRKLADSQRAYGLLEELNVKPRTRYLARLKNPMGSTK